MASNGPTASGPAPAVNGRAYRSIDHTYDVVVVGAGGAGMRATLGCAEAGFEPPASPRCFRRARTPSPRRAASPPRSATWAQDDWRWHMYDTVKGSDWLGDQDAIEYMCREAPRGGLRARALRHAVHPHRGRQDLPAPFGGHDHRVSARARRRSAPAPRPTAPATPCCTRSTASRCGSGTEFFVEYFALDLIMDEDGALPRRHRAVPGGRHASIASAPRRRCSRPAATAAPTSPARRAHTCTGDGNGMVLRAGLPLQDMEFVQFHPTGIYGAGVPDHRRRARRGRLSHQLRRRALHGALCAARQGSRLARRRLALR